MPLGGLRNGVIQGPARQAADEAGLLGKWNEVDRTEQSAGGVLPAQQHFGTFSERLKDYPFTIEHVSRFRSAKEQKTAIAGFNDGQVDILIGTHRILSKDLKFSDLGLLIVDEEQRFGVRHKERIKQMRKQVDVLTMSATPIPSNILAQLPGNPARDF